MELFAIGIILFRMFISDPIRILNDTRGIDRCRDMKFNVVYRLQPFHFLKPSNAIERWKSLWHSLDQKTTTEILFKLNSKWTDLWDEHWAFDQVYTLHNLNDIPHCRNHNPCIYWLNVLLKHLRLILSRK